MDNFEMSAHVAYRNKRKKEKKINFQIPFQPIQIDDLPMLENSALHNLHGYNFSRVW